MNLVLRGWIKEQVVMGLVMSRTGADHSSRSPFKLCKSVGLPQHNDPISSVISHYQSGALSYPIVDHQMGVSSSPSRLSEQHSKGVRKTSRFPFVSA